MATVESTEVQSADPVQDRVGVIATSATVTLPATGAGTAAGDIIQMVKVPNGARVLDVFLAADDLDTDGSPTITLSVGDGDDDDRYIVASTIGQASGVARLSSAVGADKVYTAEDTIDVKVVAAATAKQAGDITLTVWYQTTAGG